MPSSSPYRIVLLDGLQDPKINGILNVFLQAFKDDVVTKAMVAGRDDLLELMNTSIIRAGAVAGQFHLALNEKDEVVGTACWFPPGADFLADDKQKEQGMNALFERLKSEEPALFDWWINTYAPVTTHFADKYMATYPGENVKLTNFTLYGLAVLPEYQGRGIASQLVKAGEVLAKAQNVKVIFEAASEHNAIIYNKLGYTEKGTGYVSGLLGSPGFHFHLMAKNPEDIK